MFKNKYISFYKNSSENTYWNKNSRWYRKKKILPMIVSPSDIWVEPLEGSSSIFQPPTQSLSNPSPLLPGPGSNAHGPSTTRVRRETDTEEHLPAQDHPVRRRYMKPGIWNPRLMIPRPFPRNGGPCPATSSASLGHCARGGTLDFRPWAAAVAEGQDDGRAQMATEFPPENWATPDLPPPMCHHTVLFFIFSCPWQSRG